MTTSNGRFHVTRAEDAAPAPAPRLEAHAAGLRRTALAGRHVGAVHTGWALVSLASSGHVDVHLHSNEQSFYVLSGHPLATVDGRTYRLSPGEGGLLPVGVPHAWRNDAAEEAVWLEVNCPAPRISGPPDTFWIGSGAPTGKPTAPDIRDPRTRTLFRLGAGEMDVGSLKLGAAVDAPTVSASLAPALLAHGGIAVKPLVDGRLGAVLHMMLMVEYQPGGVAQPHDHPLEEARYILEGEVDAEADGEALTLRPGDFLWTGVGCIHAFSNRSSGRVRWLETQSPQPPANHSYRFNRDWDYLAAQLAAADSGASS